MASSDLRPPNHKAIRKKKTRELPNLSDCHACKRRTNSTNPSDRLRILNSHWRIVLLCKSCYNHVESSKLCSYCLTDLPAAEDSGADKGESVHQCRRCLRQVHRTCVSTYSRFAPFSFLPPDANSGSRAFSICIDCWVPRLLDNKLRGADSKGMIKAVSDSCSPGISRVSDCHERPRSAEEVVNDADCVAQKKSLIAEAARAKAMMKADVARGAVELANGALDLVFAGREGEQDDKSSDDCDLVDGYDKRLALRLHRAMNSSPRISKGLHLSMKTYTKSSVVLKLNDDSSQERMETSSIKSMNVGSEGNSVNVESQSCNKKKYVVVCGLAAHNDGPHPECARFFRKYSRRASSKNS